MTGIGRKTPVAPGIAELGGEPGVELEASPRQFIEGATAAPVERQEAARLAGGGAGDGVALDHRGLRAAPAEEVGDCDSDRATAADDDASCLAHVATVSGSASRFQTERPAVRTGAGEVITF